MREMAACFTETVARISRESQQSDRRKNTITQEARNSIPTFNPDDSHQNIETWLEKIEDLRRMYGWDEVTTSTFMTGRLQGLARKWYDSLPSVALSWEQWKNSITNAFKDRTELPVRLTKMLARKKEPAENMGDYFYDKAALVTACGFKGSDAVQCIAAGIYDDAIQAAIKLSAFQSPDELRTYLASYDTPRLSERNKERVEYKKPFKSRQHRSHSHHREKTENHRNFSKSELKKAGKDGGCFKCGERGHYARDCGELPDKSKKSISEKQVRKINTSGKKLDSRFFDVLINDQQLRAYVDLGSEAVTIRKSEAEKLKLEITPSKVVLRGYGGSSIQPYGLMKAVIKVDLAVAEVEALVVPDNLQEVPMIIGQSFTDQPHVVVLQKEGSLRLFENDAAALPEVERLPPRKVALWAKEAVVIPPGMAANIQVNSKDYEGDLFVELSIRSEENAEHCIPRCIMNTTVGLLPVVNLSDNELKIREGQTIARAEIVHEASAEELRVMSIKRNDQSELPPLPPELIKTGQDVPAYAREKVIEILNSYRDCFAQNMSELGKTNIAEIEIELTSSTPVYYRPYRLSYSEREKVKDIVNELKENGIIRDSNSPFASPILLVRKKNGETRMCVDYRALNKITKRDRFPLPLIEDQVNNLQGATRYTCLDAASCFHQIPVAQNSIEKTSFVTPDGQYEYLRQPFGLVNAPAVCQRMANRILIPLRGKINVQAYIDDYIIASDDCESAIKDLELFLQRLREVGLTLRLDKCTFLMKEINFLGYEIGNNKVRPSYDKIKAVAEFKPPSNVHEVRQFMGLASYFRKFIKNFATIGIPLTSLTKKAEAWRWGEAEESAFQQLKSLLISRPVLAIYNQKAEPELHTDASKLGLSGILMQKQDNNALHPVAYFSRQTTKEEQRYHSYELETLAVISSLHRFRVFVLGTTFKIITDCSALRATFVKRDLSPRIGRWWIQLQEYDCSIDYRPGVKMGHADALSRNAISDPKNAEEIQEIGLWHIEHDDLLLLAQRQDDRLKHVHEVLQREARDKEEKSIQFSLFFELASRKLTSYFYRAILHKNLYAKTTEYSARSMAV